MSDQKPKEEEEVPFPDSPLSPKAPSFAQELTEELQQLLYDGQGETMYDVKIGEDMEFENEEEVLLHYQLKIETLKKVCKKEGCAMTLLLKPDGKAPLKGKPSIVQKALHKVPTKFMIRRFSMGSYIDMRVAVCGNVDSGKSTITGVLCTGKLDDGRGLARSHVFMHKHEQNTGRTSSVAQQIMGMDVEGNIVAASGDKQSYSVQHWKNIVEKSAKICTLIDLAGHEKYLKTTVFGIVGNAVDYAAIVVGANMGLTKMTKEHLGLCLALKIPIFIIVTKIDICPKNILEETLASIHKILKLPGVRKVPYHCKTKQDVINCAANMHSGRVTPLLLVSSVTGENIDLLKCLMNVLPVKRDVEKLAKEKPVFVIDNTYYVTGVGTVISGIMRTGKIKPGDDLVIGPDSFGYFRKVQIKSIHSKRTPVDEVQAGQQACFALKKEKRSNIRKGMVVGHPGIHACWEFEAEILVLYHSTTIKVNYQPVIHSMCVRQCAQIKEMDGTDELRTRDKARVRFRFMFRAEYLHVGSTLIFREGRTKGFGMITKIYPIAKPE